MQTLVEIANDRSQTIVFPMPMDLLETLSRKMASGVTLADEARGTGAGDEPRAEPPRTTGS